MKGQVIPSPNSTIDIYVIDSTDGKIKDRFATGIRDCVDVMVRQAQDAISKLNGDYFLATNEHSIAREYGLELRVGFER
ncbi:MAG: hypothetical protein AABX33_01675 [Nanoarchaeota archaeon]